MLVLQIANDYLGTKLYVSLFNALGDVGVTNMIFVPIQTNCSYRKENDGLRKENGSSLIISGCFHFLDRLLFYSKQKKIYKGIRTAVDLKNIKVVHAHTLFSAGYTAMNIKREEGIPYIIAVRNVDVNIFFKRMAHLRGLGVEIMHEAARVVFLSPAYREKVIKKYVPDNYKKEILDKSLVIPNGISEFFLENKGTPKKLTDGKIRLLYAGEINRNKNLEETIEACKILRKKGFDCSFTAVGDATDRKGTRLIKKGYMTHYARCDHEELIEHYRNNDIFVMPSHTETFGLVYVEAMSQGLPVIYTRGQGFDGQFPEGKVGFSVSDRDADEMAGIIIKMINAYSVMSEDAIKESSRFDWISIANEYVSVYKKCCEVID